MNNEWFPKNPVPSCTAQPPGSKRFDSCFCGRIPLWRGELCRLQPLSLPDMRLEGALRENQQTRCFSIIVPHADERATALGIERRYYISAVFAAFLARHTGVSDFQVGYKSCALAEELVGFEGLCATTLPLHLCLDIKQFASGQIPLRASQIQSAEQHATYPRDLALRCPELRSAALPRFPIVIEHTLESEAVSIVQDAAVTLFIPPDGRSCMLTCAVFNVKGDQIWGCERAYARSHPQIWSPFTLKTGEPHG